MPEAKPPPVDPKAARLAKALRDNLRRRKSGADNAGGGPPPPPASDREA